MTDLDALLEQSSRTFALTIPFLPEPTRREVTVAYLLFRIADTLEDGELWDKARRVAALREFDALFLSAQAPQAVLANADTEANADKHAGPNPPALPCATEPGTLSSFLGRLDRSPPTAHPGYLGLLRDAAAVFGALDALRPRAREVIVRHLLVTVRGMAEGLAEGAGVTFRLRSLTQLQRYCYLVAGVVGEMLTELFLLDAPLSAAADTLRAHAIAFGEGLQLTNILKDQQDDAQEERHFLPDSVPRASLFRLARHDLEKAARYVGALVAAKAPEGMVAFTALPVRLALDTLRAVEQHGAGAKVSREQLAQALAEVGELLRGEKKLDAIFR